MSPVRNLRLAAQAVVDNLVEDPFHFFLQLSRRLPARWVRPAALFILGVTPSNSTHLAPVASELLIGNQAGLGRRLELALKKNLARRAALRLADLALVAGRPDEADMFLARALGSADYGSTLARRFWYDGAVTKAIAALPVDTEWKGKHFRQRTRLLSERALLTGWAPVLPPTSIEPVSGRVMHLLTNSLPHTQSGYAQRSHSILQAQQERGWETLALTRLGYPVSVGKLWAHQQDSVNGISYRRLLPPRIEKNAIDRVQQQAEETLKIALEFRPSVIHTTTPYVNALIGRAVAEALDIPWVYEVRGQLADTWASTRDPKATKSERYRWLQNRESDAMRSADLVVTLGESMKKNIVAAGIQSERVMIAPNAVGGDFLSEPRTTAEARGLLGLDANAQIIGTVSSLVPYEGLDTLISAFALLARVNPQVQLVIVGGGVSLPDLETQAKEAGLRDRVIFTGVVPRAQATIYHQALDIFVLPRRDLEVTRSVTPLKPVEALACARPVVGSNLPAIREIVTDGVNGALVPPEDPAALGSALSKLLADAPLRRKMGRRGRQQVLSSRTWLANAEAYTDAYNALARAGSRSDCQCP